MLKLIMLLKRIKNFKIKLHENKIFYNCKFGAESLKLHLGCGTKYKDGWVNIDNNSYGTIQKLDLNYDLSKGIPFKDNSVDFIYNEHFIEHLDVKDGLKFMKECKRVLKKNGVLRIAAPDLDSLVKSLYTNKNWREDGKEFFKRHRLEFVKTKAEYMNVNFRYWGHKWLYDREELERRLKEAGFNNVKFCELNDSEYDELKNVETRNESKLIAEVIKQ